MRIPQSFQLMGCTYNVVIIPKKQWKFGEDEVGVFDPLNKTICLRKENRELMEHTYFHEVTHAVLGAMNHKLYEDESFVDLFSGLLHQALQTAE